MDHKLSPRDFGLHPRTVIEQLDEKTIAILIERKSRIIMADGKKILEKFEILKQHRPEAKFALKTTAPVCSKTKAFFEKQGIAVLPG